MENLTQINEHIYRLKVPFKDIYTTVCILRTEAGVLVFDTATYESDITEIVLPALTHLGVTADQLKYIFISHNHGDHAGGLATLAQHFPQACIVSRSPALRETYAEHPFCLPEDGEVLMDVLQVVAIPGHTADSAALLDRRTGTLIVGDSLQLYGIYGSGNWGANISYPVEHTAAIEKLRGMDLHLVIAAHEYHPCGYRYEGKEQIHAALNACTEALLGIKQQILAHPDLDNVQLCALYNEQSGLPTIGKHVVAAIRRATESGAF